jgi:hypothetical protein
MDPFFDELRDPSTRLPNGGPLPHLFNFTEEEKAAQPEACAQATPAWWLAQQQNQ